jgi:hypothetical protein
MLKILKIQSKCNSNQIFGQPNLNPDNIDLISKKDNKNFVKYLLITLYLFLVCQNFQDQKLKCRIRDFELY